MSKWTANDNCISVDSANWQQYAAGPGFAEAIVARHNSEIAALEAKCDEWQKKCQQIVDIIQPHGHCPCSPFAISTSEAVWNARNKLYERAVAIAEGRNHE